MELVLATVGSSIVTLELCSLRVLRTFTLPLNQGPPSCVYADRGRQWVAIGTSLGILSVWDARFALPVRTWSASTTGRVRFCLRHPLKSRWVLVAAESADETFLQSYEVESGRLMETFTTSGSSATAAPHPSASLPDSLVTLAPAVSDADIDKAMAQILAARSRQRSSPPLTPVSAVLAIAVQSRAHQSTGLRNEGVVSGPTVFTAGLSGRIRCLNFADLQRSRMLAPPGSEVKASYLCVASVVSSCAQSPSAHHLSLSSFAATRPGLLRSRTRRSRRLRTQARARPSRHSASLPRPSRRPFGCSLPRSRAASKPGRSEASISVLKIMRDIIHVARITRLRPALSAPERSAHAHPTSTARRPGHRISVGVRYAASGAPATASAAAEEADEAGAAEVDRIVPRRTFTYLTFLTMLSTTLRSWPRPSGRRSSSRLQVESCESLLMYVTTSPRDDRMSLLWS